MLVSVHYNNTIMKKLFIISLIQLVTFKGYSQLLSLQQCIDSAIKNNYNVRIADYELKQAKERLLEARGNLLPKINTAVDYRYYTNLPYQLMPATIFGGPKGSYKEVQFGVPHNINANVQLNYPLYNAVLQANIKTIQTAEELSYLQNIKSQEDIALDVSNVYYNAQILLNQQSFNDSNIVNSKKLMALMELLYQQKMTKGTDVDKVNLQLSQLLTQKETVQNQYFQVINTLKFLIGKSPDDSISIELATGKNEYQVLQNNPLTEIKLAEKQISFLQTEKTFIQKSKLPVINLNGFYGTTGFARIGSNDFLKFFPLGYAGVQVIMPLYNGNTTMHKIKGKEIEIEKATVKAEMLKAKYNVDRLNNVYQLNNAQKNIIMIQQQIEFAQTIYRKTLLQQKEGVAALTDVLLADNSVREAQQNYTIALITLRRAELEQQKLTGNLLIK